MLLTNGTLTYLRNEKVNGTSGGILPELLKASSEHLNLRLVSLFQDVWRTGSIPHEKVESDLTPGQWDNMVPNNHDQ